MINNRRLAALALCCLLVAVGCVPNLPTGPGGTGGTGGKKDTKKASPSPAASASASTSPSSSPSTGTSPSPSPSASISPSGLTNGFFAAQVLGLDGQPAANVLIKSYVISTGGGNVISTGGGNVISTGGGNFVSTNSGGVISTGGGNYQVLQTAEVKTDANGKFLIKPLTDGNKLTVEAVADTNVKALQLDIGAETRDFTMKLAKTGSISGKVSAPEAPSVTDFLGIDVFIPGTSYTGKTDASGNFTLSNLPVGKFTVVAKHETLGLANANEVVVESEKTTTVSSLPLSIKAPTVTKVEPAIAGPDKEVTITGTGFGATEGKTFQVTFGGLIATAPTRVDDFTIKVKVPATASTNGELIVSVGSLPSAAFAFKILKDLTIEGERSEILKGTSRQFTVKGRDMAEAAIVSPPVTWSVSGAGATIDQTGKLTVTQSGEVTVTAESGTRKDTFTLKVVNELYTVSTLAGSDIGYEDALGTAAKFNAPADLGFDPAGNLYVMDTGNLCIRRIAAGGAVTTYVPKNTLEAEIDTGGNLAGMVVNGSSNLFLLDGGARTIYKIDLQGHMTAFAGGGNGTALGGGAIDYASMIYAMGLGTNQAPIIALAMQPVNLRMFDPTATEMDFSDGITWPGTLGNSNVNGLGFDQGQNLYVAFMAGQGSKLVRVTPLDAVQELAGGAASIVDGTGAQAGLGMCIDMAVDPQGNVYMLESAMLQVGDPPSYRIRKISAAGVVSLIAGGAPGYTDGAGSVAKFNNPRGITIGTDGNLYVADMDNNRIRKVTVTKAN